MAEQKLRLLAIGPLPPPVGGVTVAFQYLVDHLEEHPGIELRVLDDGGIRGREVAAFLRLCRLLSHFAGAVSWADVVTLHCNPTALHVMGPLVLILSRLLRKRVVIRKFAGDDYLSRLGALGGRVADWAVRRADLYLVETRQLLEHGRSRGLKNIDWFPNHRAVCGESSWDQPKESCSRFVYVGHVRAYKGMDVLVDAARKLPDGVTVDVYGPWFDDLDRSIFDKSPNIVYRGALRPDEVVAAMRRYDAFVMPTVASTEGYPGAILEAYAAALPIVTSRIGAISEIVDDTVGFLVPPRDADALSLAMTRLSESPDVFGRLRANTRTKAEFFSVAHWGDRFVELCRIVAGIAPPLAETDNPEPK